jgi:oxygen-independent coproporphyrinogen-3 oxidase
MTGFGVYVHVPFCTALCPYCDFAVVVGRASVHERYCDALVEEARGCADLPEASSLFIGGGTPTTLDAALLGSTLDRIGGFVSVSPDAEITVEANPESASVARLGSLATAGINRVSVGAQSFDPDVLRALGRTHSVEQIGEAVRAARAAGIANVSVDLIYGGPGETMQAWTRSLEETLRLGVDHVSCYALTIEAATPFGKAVARGAMSEPDQDDLARKYETAIEILERAGYRHYEISNWARPGYESRHNLLYWTQGDYVGLGIGAHSHRDGVRWWNTRALKGYLDDPAHARAGEERLSAEQRAEEWLSLQMRLIGALDLDEARARLGRDVRSAAESCAHLGLLSLDDGVLRLTPRGMLLENEVTLRLLSA